MWSHRIKPQSTSVAGQSCSFQDQKSFELCTFLVSVQVQRKKSSMSVSGRGPYSCLRGRRPSGVYPLRLRWASGPTPPPAPTGSLLSRCSTQGCSPGCTSALSGRQARENNLASKKVHFPTGQAGEGGSRGRQGTLGTTAWAVRGQAG